MVAPSLVGIAACLALAVACAPRADATEFKVRMLVTNVPGDPLANVPISLSGKTLARTDTDGFAKLTLLGREGMRASLRVECPPNHRQPTELTSVGLYAYAAAAEPEVRTICQQLQVNEGIVVRSVGAAELPFAIRGQKAGMTDAAGIAHVLAMGEPGETIDIIFDTSAQPDLQPANPSVRVLLGNHDDVALADQRFESRASQPKAVKHRGGKPNQATTRRQDGPVRIR